MLICYLNWPVIIPAPTLVMGTDSNAGNTDVVPTYVYYTRVQANANKIITHLTVYARLGGYMRGAIYSDSPANLLSESESINVNSDWNDIEIPNIAVVSGTYYWLGLQDDQDARGRAFSEAGHGYEAQAYGAFPAVANMLANAFAASMGAIGY